MQHLIRHLSSPEFLKGVPTFTKYLPPQEAKYEKQDRKLNPEVKEALLQSGIERLFTHQKQALDVVNDGQNPLIVTPTASGKSLVYQLAILEELKRNPGARALLIFPLKALEQDQHQRLQELMKLAKLSDSCRCAILDGDTPRDEREKLRAEPPNLLLTNPDMLHYGILPNHRGWSAFFRDLRFIVIDELHIYRGIFGTHVLQVLSRLGRIYRFYEADPHWIAGSATIGNPLELAQELTGQDFELVERSGAPTSGRHFLLLNPTELSPYTLAARLFPEVIYQGYKAIAFTKSRRATELLHRWILESHPEMEDRFSSYRAGFLPQERRDIENKLLTDKLSGVISTSALELGMDIGGIDVALLLGYPGTISALMQRAGRAGRRERDSLVILIAGEDALDQYFMRHPEELFLRPSEAAIVDGTNEDILKSHMVCGSAEIPLAEKEPYLNEDKKQHIDPLITERRLIPGAGGRRWFPGIPNPHRKINIRSVGETYSIHDSKNGKQIGDIGEARLWTECHPQAIYLHRARQYLVEKLDDAAKIVYARSADLDYYTMALGEKETEILSRKRDFEVGCGRAVEGELKVTERVTGFQKRRLHGGELISTHELDGPPQVLKTRGFWIELEEALQELVEEYRFHYMGSLHATEHALISVFPLQVMCDRGDVGGISFTHHPQVGGPAIFVYDAYPGGLGISKRAFEHLDGLIGRTLSLVQECPCESGCPSCIHSPRCGAGNRPLDKPGAVLVMQRLLALEEIEPPKPVAVEEKPELNVVSVIHEVKLQGIIRELPDKLKKKQVIAFDLETQRGPEAVGGWGNAHLMGLSLAIVKDLNTGKYRTYREEDIDDLIDDLFEADCVVGFNCIQFDFSVLSGYSGRDFGRVKAFDLLRELQKASGKRHKLDALAEINLGEGKSGSGDQAIVFYNGGQWDELEAYCRRDVEITGDLFYLAVNHGRLRIPTGGGGYRMVQIEGTKDGIQKNK